MQNTRTALGLGALGLAAALPQTARAQAVTDTFTTLAPFATGAGAASPVRSGPFGSTVTEAFGINDVG